MKHHTKEKGDLGVLAAQLDLAKQGYLVLWPITEHAPFDLVAYSNSKFIRIQVKYISLNKRGQIAINFRSCWSDRHGTHIKKIDKTQIDMYCIYCPDTYECYYVDPHKYNECMTLRTKPPMRTNKKCHMVNDFRICPCSSVE